MRLYDTAQRRVVPFVPQGSTVGIYVCGITPYDSAHLGHAFTYHVFDIVTRRLRLDGLTVRSVRNVTDVDDDILRVARERGVDWTALASAQVRQFEHDMARIGLLPADAIPRASEHVPEMIEWITRLEARGSAYAVDGWVYFDTATYPGYGRLSRLDRDAMIALSLERGANPDDPRKRDALDFVLWQPSGPGEPRWASPWSDGRPGWHIECTVLSTGSLHVPIDIHGGGDDLVYPHHESEIAQAEAVGVTPYVRYWMHVAMVQLDGVKMSKSLGNLVFVSDLLDKVPALTVRLLLSSHHYRGSWAYEEAELRDADSRRERYAAAMSAGGELSSGDADEWRARFWERIDDDLDTPGALRVVDELVAALGAASTPTGSGRVSADSLLSELLDVVGARAPSLTA